MCMLVRVCVCVCQCVYVYVYVSACMCVCVYASVCLCVTLSVCLLFSYSPSYKIYTLEPTYPHIISIYFFTSLSSGLTNSEDIDDAEGERQLLGEIRRMLDRR